MGKWAISVDFSTTRVDGFRSAVRIPQAVQLDSPMLTMTNFP